MSTIRSDKWFFRITLPHSIIKEKLSQLLEWVDLTSCLVATHVGDKTEKEHAHFVIAMSSTLQKQSLDIRIKKIYAVSRADYSSKPWDGDVHACSYLFHDTTAQILSSKGHTAEDIERYKSLNDDVQKVIAVNKSRASTRIPQRVADAITASAGQWTRKQIARHIIDLIRQGEVYEPGDYQLKRYIEEIYMKQLTKDQYEHYAEARAYTLVSAYEDQEIIIPYV